MKKTISLIILTGLLLTISTGCGCSKKKKVNPEPDVKINTNKDVVKDQKLEVFTFTNTALVYEDHTSILTTKVTNTSDKAQYLKEFTIHVKDANGKEIVSMPGFVGDNIPAKSSTTITTSYADDLTTAHSISYEIKR